MHFVFIYSLYTSCTVLCCIVNRPAEWHIAHITRKMSKSRTGQRSKKKKKKKKKRKGKKEEKIKKEK